MEPRAQLRNKKILPWTVLTVALTLGCGHNRHVVPFLWTNTAEGNISTRQGITRNGQQPISGWLFTLYPNGDTAYTAPFLAGKEEGTETTWYPGGQPETVRIYKEGKKTGTHRGWWPGGTLKFEYQYAGDVYDGVVKEWNEAGRLIREFHYQNGQENGTQKQFFPDGTLQLNYVARNGRNYGLTGVKNCVNVKDSIENLQ